MRTVRFFDYFGGLDNDRGNMENQSFLISANAAGINRGTQYVGQHSMVVDPSGMVVAGTGDEETIVQCRIDPQKV